MPLLGPIGVEFNESVTALFGDIYTAIRCDPDSPGRVVPLSIGHIRHTAGSNKDTTVGIDVEINPTIDSPFLTGFKCSKVVPMDNLVPGVQASIFLCTACIIITNGGHKMIRPTISIGVNQKDHRTTGIHLGSEIIPSEIGVEVHVAIIYDYMVVVDSQCVDVALHRRTHV